MAVWTEFVGIFDASCGTFSSPSYNPDNIDVSGKTEGENYIILKVLAVDEPEIPDVSVKQLPKRMNMPAGMGKTELTVNITGYVARREAGTEKNSAIKKYNKLVNFVRKHDEMSDTEVFLVMRERNADDNGWDYAEYEDIASPTHNFNVKFVKGKCAGITKKYATYGYIEYKLQFVEAWF